jgi:hypothetical protein
MPSEAVLKPGHDRPGRGDGKLLTRDLKDQRRECVERRKLGQPGSGAETGSCVDQRSENRIRVPKKLASLAIRDRSPPTGLGVDAQGCTWEP